MTNQMAKTIADLTPKLQSSSGAFAAPGVAYGPIPTGPVVMPMTPFTPEMLKPIGPGQGDHDLKLPVVTRHAASFLDEAVSTMRARAVLRDAGASGERSMARTVAIFNAWTGNSMSVEDGWRFMIALKQAREVQGFYNADDYVDLAAYAALLAEEESGNADRKAPEKK